MSKHLNLSYKSGGGYKTFAKEQKKLDEFQGAVLEKKVLPSVRDKQVIDEKMLMIVFRKLDRFQDDT